MTDDGKPQSYRPPIRGQNHYAAFKDFKKEITKSPPKEELAANGKELFSMNITASIKGERMEEPELNEQFFIDMIFKPNESGLRLRPEETQLLLAYIGEILKEIEIEEKLIIEEEKAKQEQGDNSCK